MIKKVNMQFLHKELAGGRWYELSLAEQLAHIGSEISRANRWQNKDEKIFWSATERALELFYLTISDKRWRLRLKELTRLREIFCDAVLGGKEYCTKLTDLERYFYYFTLYSQLQKIETK